jgi:hypothetical protein
MGLPLLAARYRFSDAATAAGVMADPSEKRTPLRRVSWKVVFPLPTYPHEVARSGSYPPSGAW